MGSAPPNEMGRTEKGDGARRGAAGGAAPLGGGGGGRGGGRVLRGAQGSMEEWGKFSRQGRLALGVVGAGCVEYVTRV